MNCNLLLCPVCSESLFLKDKTFSCKNNHCFDVAKEGYVNLLSGAHKSGELMGDNKSMARSRRDFLEKGYFSVLADFLSKKVSLLKPKTILDICCGEGYYSSKLDAGENCELYGFDLSKEMVRLSAKRKLDSTFFVANLSSIPLKNHSIDFAFHLFAPFNEKEFSRILSKNGKLFTVVPGGNHLFSLKKLVYETPYKNDEKLPETTSLKLVNTHKLSNRISLNSHDDIMSLFMMTPYFYHTSKSDKEKLENVEKLETEIEFVVGEYVLNDD